MRDKEVTGPQDRITIPMHKSDLVLSLNVLATTRLEDEITILLCITQLFRLGLAEALRYKFTIRFAAKALRGTFSDGVGMLFLIEQYVDIHDVCSSRDVGTPTLAVFYRIVAKRRERRALKLAIWSELSPTKTISIRRSPLSSEAATISPKQPLSNQKKP